LSETDTVPALGTPNISWIKGIVRRISESPCKEGSARLPFKPLLSIRIRWLPGSLRIRIQGAKYQPKTAKKNSFLLSKSKSVEKKRDCQISVSE